jgi:putative ABC transport system ATP-binding protein
MAVRSFELPVRYGMPGEPIIQMRGITKTFRTGEGETTVLKNLDIQILQGQFVSIVGRSGSGKSTLVNMITGIDHPSTGLVRVGNVDIHNMDESSMAVWRGKNLGIVFQFFQLLPMLSLIENVMLPMDFCNIYSPASREERALGLLRQVGLEELAHKPPGAVAGGQQQCAALARALANDPPIIIADEPTGNLDSNTAETVMGIFEGLETQGKTILIVTHDRTLAQRTNRQLLISDGELANEYLVAAFPEVSHSLLLSLSKSAVSTDLQPRALLKSNKEATAPIYLITKGELVFNQNGQITWIKSGEILDPLKIPHDLYTGPNGANLLGLPRQAATAIWQDFEQASDDFPANSSSRNEVNHQTGEEPHAPALE